MKKILKKMFKNYVDSTIKTNIWLTTGCTYVPWMTGKE